MTLEEECRLSYYKEIAVINEQHKIYLVQNVETNKIFVMKKLYIYNLEIYRYLKSLQSGLFPRIYECVECEDCMILIEEYINGDTISEMIQKQGTFGLWHTAQIVGSVCDALQIFHTHQPPIIHRDIKPSNIMISNDGR